MRLSASTQSALPAVARQPDYEPANHDVGIVHLGIGAFHRAHQAVYCDDVLARAGGDWRILGVSLRSSAVRDQLVPQDGRYTLVVRDGHHEELRVIASVADVIVASADPGRVVAALATPTTHVVTLTVTEKGYCHDPASGDLSRTHPDIVHDLANPDMPRSAIGYLAAGLAARRHAGSGPLTIVSCDNLPHNGAVLQRVLSAFVAQSVPALLDWMDSNVSFPATMVDRIVPATTDADRAALAERLGMADHAMVKAEPFSQWVIEDRFAGPRPRFEAVGVQLVDDVRPFELAKLRMLNGAHSTIAYLGLHHGHTTVDAAIADPRIADVVDALMTEAASTLPVVPGLDPIAYAAALKLRFGNAALAHRLAQIAMDGSQKLPQRLLGTIADIHAAGGVPRAAATGVAAWLYHLSSAHLDDPLADQLRAVGRADPAERIAVALPIDAIFGALGRERWFHDLLRAVMPR